MAWMEATEGFHQDRNISPNTGTEKKKKQPRIKQINNLKNKNKLNGGS